jgi:hypothetical protein
MINRVGNAVVLFDIDVNLSDGSLFSTRMSRKWFLKNYILSDHFSAGTGAFCFEDYEVEDRLFNATRLVFEYINSLGGFQVIGWVKRGEVEDQGVDQPNNGLHHNAQRVMVQSGNLNHHISRLEPMHPQDVNPLILDGYKFDVTSGFDLEV